MNKIYGFTNECVSAYPSIYNFDGSNVLSVLGSGDQYFTAILNGAKNVDVFDLNMVAWYHFLLKFNAIKYFTYEEFYKFFVTYNLNDLNDYLKLRNYLPDYAKEFFDNLYKQHKQLSSIKISNIFFDNYDMENYQRIIPYFNIDSETARNYNQQIKSLFKDKSESVLSSTSRKNVIFNVKYKVYENNNILSLVILSELKEGNSNERIIIQTYNYNLETNQMVNVNDIINQKNINTANAL